MIAKRVQVISLVDCGVDLNLARRRGFLTTTKIQAGKRFQPAYHNQTAKQRQRNELVLILLLTMAPHYSSQKLLADLSDHNAFFDMIVDMIPSKLYISGQSGDDYNPKNRFYRGVTEDSKEARKAAAKLAKRRKLDPLQAESTVDKKERLEKDEQIATPSSAIQGQSLSAPKSQQHATTTTTTSSPYQSRIEALRAKLHAKIAEKQAHRPNPDQVSKRAARRAEKRRRQEEAAKRKRAGSSSKVDELKAAAAAQYKMASSSSQALVDPSQDLMHLDFGRLSGLNNNNKTSENYAETNKSLANLSKSKNLKKMLADAEEKRKKLQELKKARRKRKPRLLLYNGRIHSRKLMDSVSRMIQPNSRKPLSVKPSRKPRVKRRGSREWNKQQLPRMRSKKFVNTILQLGSKAVQWGRI